MDECEKDQRLQHHMFIEPTATANVGHHHQLPAQLPNSQLLGLDSQGAAEALQISQLLHTFDSQKQHQQPAQNHHLHPVTQPASHTSDGLPHPQTLGLPHKQQGVAAPANCSVFQAAAGTTAASTQHHSTQAPQSTQPAGMAPVSMQHSSVHIVAATPPLPLVSAASQQQQQQQQQPPGPLLYLHQHQQQQQQQPHQNQYQQPPVLPSSGTIQGGAALGAFGERGSSEAHPMVYSNCAPELQLRGSGPAPSASAPSGLTAKDAAAAARAARQRKRKEMAAAAAAEKAAAAQGLQGGSQHVRAAPAGVPLPPPATLAPALPAASTAGAAGLARFGAAGASAGLGAGLPGSVLHLGMGSGRSDGEEGGGVRGAGLTWDGGSYGDIAGLDGLEEGSGEKSQKRMIKNRESAARSRARRQEYTAALEQQVAQLRQQNQDLRVRVVLAGAAPSDPHAGQLEGQLLRRTRTTPM